MKKLSLIFAFLLLCVTAFSQVDSVIDATSLTSDQAFEISSVDSYSRPATPQKKKTRLLQPQLTSPILTRGPRMFVDFSVHQGIDEYSCDVVDFGVSVGWQLNPYLFLGIGISEQFYSDHYYYGYYEEESQLAFVLPLFLEARYDVFKKKITPYFDFRFGYAASDDTYNDYNGVYYNGSVGLRLWKASLSFGIESVKLNTPYSCYTPNFSYVESLSMANWFLKFTYEWGGAY